MGATPSQRKVRQAFKKCVNCFKLQPQTGGATPPAVGPRSREWWYDEASGMWYYNYFIAQSMPFYLDDEVPDWCKIVAEGAGGDSCWEDIYGDFYQTDDVIEMPFGRIANYYWMEDAWARCYVGLDISTLSSETINALTSAQCLFTYHGNTINAFTAYVHTWSVASAPDPEGPSDISIAGAVLASWANSSGDSSKSFEFISFLKSEKALGRAAIYFSFNGSIEGTGSSNRSGEIYGVDHPVSPMQFVLS